MYPLYRDGSSLLSPFWEFSGFLVFSLLPHFPMPLLVPFSSGHSTNLTLRSDLGCQAVVVEHLAKRVLGRSVIRHYFQVMI